MTGPLRFPARRLPVLLLLLVWLSVPVFSQEYTQEDKYLQHYGKGL